MIKPNQPNPNTIQLNAMNTLCLKVVQIVTVLIFAVYALATSLPTLALSLRQFSNPIFVFLLLNTSIFLLSLPRFFPHPNHTTTPMLSSSSPVVIPPSIDMEIEDEFETEDVGAVAEDSEMGIEPKAVVTEITSSEMRERSVEDVERVIEEEAMEEEEVSNAEFNRIIEAFLAKQKKFHYQENISIFV